MFGNLGSKKKQMFGATFTDECKRDAVDGATRFAKWLIGQIYA